MTKKPVKRKPAPAKLNSNKPKTAVTPGTLPAAIINALPASAQIMRQMAGVEQLIPSVVKDMAKAEKGGAIQMARAFVALHRMASRIDDILKPLFGKDQLLDQYKNVKIPALFEAEGIKNVPLAEGFRVGLSVRFFASIVPGQQDAAYDWLRQNGLESIIKETVNSQTLSAAGKEMLETKNTDLPKELFNVALVPNTSVTKTD